MSHDAYIYSTAVTAITVGFAFQYFDGRDGNHLHFVISDTTFANVVVVNTTTYNRWSDGSCIIDAGDHQGIHWQSCIAYSYAFLIGTFMLSQMVLSGGIIARDRASDDLLVRMWNGAATTRHLPLDCQAALREQGLI